MRQHHTRAKTVKPGRQERLQPEAFAMSYGLHWTMPFAAGGFVLQGYSRAADRTGFCLPELGWVLDAGVKVSSTRPEHIFLTHTHSDHVHDLTFLKSRNKPPHIYVPAESVELLDRYFHVAQELTSHQVRDLDDPWTTAYHLQGVSSGDTLNIRRGGKTYQVEVVACDHTVPCVGYAFFELRQKLKPVYASLSSSEIGQLRREGAEVTEEQRVPLFAFLGDTTERVFLQHPNLLSMPVIVVECSFLDAAEYGERGRKTKHLVWDYLEPFVEKSPETTFVLTHFSHRYQESEIQSCFEQVNSPNVLVWFP